MTKQTDEINLLTGAILPSLLQFTIPIFFSMLLQMAYGTVDLWVVANFSTTGDLAAVTIGSQLMATVSNFFAGLAMGSTILLGQYLGSKQGEKASAVVGGSVFLFFFLSLLSTVLLLGSVDLIAQWMNTPDNAYQQTKSYVCITGGGILFIVFYNLLGSIFRGIGDSKTPLYAVLIACVLNIILDLFFVGILHLGASGAALATVISQGTSVIVSLVLLRRKTLPFPFSKKDISFQKENISRILVLGFPVALQSVLVGISFLFVTAIINVFGEAATAGIGVVEKITGLIMIVPISFMQSLSAFTAQNFGAGEMKRGKLALAYGIGISLSIGVVMAYISWFHGALLTNLFLKDNPQATESALEYLRSYAFDTVFVCFIFCFTGFFNGIGKTTFVMAQAIFGACCLRIPLAYWISTWENTNLFLIGLATPISTLVQILLFVLYYLHLFQSKKQMEIPPQKGNLS